MTTSVNNSADTCPQGHDVEDLESHHDLLDSMVSRTSGETISLLQEIQKHFGFLPRNVLCYVSEHTDLKLATLYGVATFYASFFLWPRGRRVLRVCYGTACHVRGASRITTALETHLEIDSGETTPDLEYTLETVACLGCCSLAPVVSDNGRIVPRLKHRDAVHMLCEEAPEDGDS